MQRICPAQFGTGSGRVGIGLVKHTPMRRDRTSGVYKDGRPVSFIFVPSAGYKWQVLNKVSTVWCKRFDGSTVTVDDFVKDVFRDQTKWPCVVADFLGAKGLAVQLWNSARYLRLEAPSRGIV